MGLWTLCCTKTERIYGFASGTFNVTIYLREFILHIVFLICVCTIAIHSLTPTMFHLASALTFQLIDGSEVNFYSISTMKEFWRYTEEKIPSALFSEKWYNNDSLKGGHKVLYQNTLLGAVRMRQLRVRNDSCAISRDFQLSVFDCYGEYREGNEDKSEFGPGNSSAWIYTSEEETNSSSHIGLFATYSGGGYYIDLGPSQEEVTRNILFLKSNLWTDRATRVVFIDFTLYNPNVDIICVVKLICEFPPTGGLTPTWKFRTGNVNFLNTFGSYLLMGIEILFCVFVAYYWIREIGEIVLKRISYFKDLWNYIDLTVLLLSTGGIVLGIYRYYKINELVHLYFEHPNSYLDFESFGYWQTQFQYLVGVVAFFSWIHLFQFISFSSTLIQLSRTLTRCAPDLLGFGVMFLVVFLAFAQLGFLVFGSRLYRFRNLGQSIFSLLRTVLGDSDFEELQSAHRVLGPLYYISFIFFVYFVLMQMFLAIIADTYSQVKTEYEAQRKPFINPFANIFVRLTGHHDRADDVSVEDSVFNDESAQLTSNPSEQDTAQLIAELQNQVKALQARFEELNKRRAEYD